MYEICLCDSCDREFRTKKIRKDPYKNLCSICRETILGKKCLYCDDPIEKVGKGEPWNYYCGYCESVKLGEPDSKWLPGAKEDELKSKGYQKV